MAVPLNGHGLVYFPVPKIACTSLKTLFYELNNGRPFEMYIEDGVQKHIHNVAYGSPTFSTVDHASIAGKVRVAVVRDPVKRLLSAYNSRVVGLGELSEEKIDTNVASRLGVHPHPTPDFFFENLRAYRSLSIDIDHHTAPISTFLGPDLSYFQIVYRMEEIEGLTAMLSKRTGKSANLPKLQMTNGKLRFEDLGVLARQAIVDNCFGDYALLKGLYSPPEPSTWI